MGSKDIILPFDQELPSHYADRLGLLYSSRVTQEHKKDHGQFFTPIEIAVFMASYTDFTGKSVRILDPGCGSLILSCALIEHLINSNKELKCVELEAYESDSDLLPISNQSLAHLVQWGSEKGITISAILHTEDFILANAVCFHNGADLFTQPSGQFDIIISNPPYFKIPIYDKRALAGKVVVNGHPNIYAIFMALAAQLAKENGELIFITPRSFASGGYFKIFREYFFKLIDLDKVHLFVSRKDTFSRDKVLQETVIIKGIKREKSSQPVAISSSGGIKDLQTPVIKSFPKKDILNYRSQEKILYLPTNDNEEIVLEIFKKWTGKLANYNIHISTGPVVAFRSWDFIRENYENGTVHLAPLFWLHNVKQMTLEWPVVKPNKGQYILVDERSTQLLIPNKNYILLRRFSSKDDKSRLIAAPYFSSFPGSEFIGVENKVNYIYRPKGHLQRNEIVGLCALLNSNLFDSFFRIFNGNVNVSATELREMVFPPLDLIMDIGNTIIDANDFSVDYTNKVMNDFFELKNMYE